MLTRLTTFFFEGSEIMPYSPKPLFESIRYPHCYENLRHTNDKAVNVPSRFLPVMPYVLNVVVVVEGIEKKTHLLYMILVCKSSVC